MSDLDATTPRVFLARHGETEWTISGQHTGISNIPLTALGERQVSSTGALLVGPGKLLDPGHLKRVWISPRQRALKTFELLFGSVAIARDDFGEAARVVAGVDERIFGGGPGCVVVTEQIREWDYGEYEGLQAADAKKLWTVSERNNSAELSVWRDGCPGGESKADVENRLDQLIQEIQNLQAPYMNDAAEAADVVLVARGLISKCFIKRWLQLPVNADLPMMLPPGAIAMLSYALVFGVLLTFGADDPSPKLQGPRRQEVNILRRNGHPSGR